MSNGMRWLLVIPGALFLLALSVLTFSYACNIMCAHKINMKTGQVEVSSTVNSLQLRAQNMSDFLDQQLADTNKQISALSTKIKLAQTEPTKFFQPQTQAKSIAGMAAGVDAMKTESTKIGEQQRNIKELIDELNQLKRTLKNNPKS